MEKEWEKVVDEHDQHVRKGSTSLWSKSVDGVVVFAASTKGNTHLHWRTGDVLYPKGRSDVRATDGQKGVKVLCTLTSHTMTTDVDWSDHEHPVIRLGDGDKYDFKTVPGEPFYPEPVVLIENIMGAPNRRTVNWHGFAKDYVYETDLEDVDLEGESEEGLDSSYERMKTARRLWLVARKKHAVAAQALVEARSEEARLLSVLTIAEKAFAHANGELQVEIEATASKSGMVLSIVGLGTRG